MSGEGEEDAPPPAFAFGCGGSPSPSKLGEDWHEALAVFEAAAGEVRAVEAATAGYCLEEQEALLPAHEAACDALEAALRRLLGVPAPDLAALARKIELVIAHEIEPLSDGAPGWAAIRRDALTLASFDPSAVHGRPSSG
jgi:hypothetical protein